MTTATNGTERPNIQEILEALGVDWETDPEFDYLSEEGGTEEV